VNKAETKRGNDQLTSDQQKKFMAVRATAKECADANYKKFPDSKNRKESEGDGVFEDRCDE
jgi:hypothetical protein